MPPGTSTYWISEQAILQNTHQQEFTQGYLPPDLAALTPWR